MTPGQFLDAYAAGWCGGKSQEIKGACAPGYFLRDPATPTPVGLEEFEGYFRGLEALVGEKRQDQDVFMVLSEVQTAVGADGVLTAWCRWRIPGTSIDGAGLIKVGAEGVEEETLFYHAKPA